MSIVSNTMVGMIQPDGIVLNEIPLYKKIKLIRENSYEISKDYLVISEPTNTFINRGDVLLNSNGHFYMVMVASHVSHYAPVYNSIDDYLNNKSVSKYVDEADQFIISNISEFPTNMEFYTGIKITSEDLLKQLTDEELLDSRTMYKFEKVKEIIILKGDKDE